MNKRTKETLVTTFKSVISNQSCIDSAKNNPWWIAVIFFVLAFMLPLIPVMVTASNMSGGSFMASTYRYTFDEIKITNSLTSLVSDKYEITFSDSHEAELKKDNVHENRPMPTDESQYYTDGYDTYPLYRYVVNDVKAGEPIQQYALDIYFSYRNMKNKASDVENLVSIINNRKYIGGTTTLYVDQTLDEGNYTYAPSYIIFYADGMYAKVVKTNTTTAAAVSYYGSANYNNIVMRNTAKVTDKGFFDKLLNVTDKEGNLVTRNPYNTTYQEGVYQDLKTAFDDSYIDYKWKTFTYNTLVYGGVFVGLILLMGLLVFILTRGKKNMFNYLSWWTCMKISWYACLTPGIIGLILGFIIANQSLMIFVLCVGLRIMWLSMKQLRPQ